MAASVKKALWLATGIFMIVLVIGVATVVVVGRVAPDSESVGFEVGKAALQLLVLAFAGGVIGGATAFLQQVYLGEQERQAQAAKDRRRQDVRIRLILDETITAYHRLKALRRIMRARASEGLTLQAYEEFALEMIETQLTFEQQARLAAHIDGLDRLHPPKPRDDVADTGRPTFKSLETSLHHIERYVQRVVTEYEEKRRLLAMAPTTTLPYSEFPELEKFCARARESDSLQALSYHVDLVVDVLHEALLSPASPS